ncbi:MAG: hypothetical protein KJO64_09545, partial [Bacteroidia bacterium]|nr:hypothetical protein [Bacteroidia bacterium]
MHSIKSISTFYKGELASIYSSNEAKSITNLVLMHVLNYDKAQLILNEKEELGNDTEKTLTDYLDQL